MRYIRERVEVPMQSVRLDHIRANDYRLLVGELDALRNSIVEAIYGEEWDTLTIRFIEGHAIVEAERAEP